MSTAERSQDALQLEALLASRTYLYTLFHKLLGGTPNQEIVEALTSQMTLDVVDEYSADDETMRGLGAFVQGLQEKDAAALLDAAKDEYTRIFVGPAALPASPYESPYTGAHDMALVQENTLAVRAAFHLQGLRVRREQAVPDDHVALLCAFMAVLSARSLAQFREGSFTETAQGLRLEAAFADAHMTNWLGIYAESVRNSKAGSAAVVYPQLLEALNAFTAIDSTFAKESAFWLEGEEAPQAGAGVSPELAAVDEAIAELKAIRPFGIQDNELVPLD